MCACLNFCLCHPVAMPMQAKQCMIVVKDPHVIFERHNSYFCFFLQAIPVCSTTFFFTWSHIFRRDSWHITSCVERLTCGTKSRCWVKHTSGYAVNIRSRAPHLSTARLPRRTRAPLCNSRFKPCALNRHFQDLRQ